MIFPSDLRLIEDARLFLKTQKYIQQNTGTGADESRKAILQERGKQNTIRRTGLQTLSADLFSKAPIYLNGSKLESVNYGEPRNRFHKSAQELISFAFPNLRMLKGAYDEALVTKTLLDPDDLLTSGQQPLSEAEQEILTYVQRNQTKGERTSVEEMVREFGKRSYGWYPMAVITLISRLFRMGKIEIRNTDLLDAKGALELLLKPNQHGGLRVRLQEQFDATKVNALKRFHQELFDRQNEGTDARSVGQITIDALVGEARELDVLLDQSGRYAFLEALRPATEKIRKLATRDYAHLLNNLAEFEDDLLEAKENILDSIKSFMHGPQRTAYDDAIAFLKEEEANFQDLPTDEIQPLKDLATASTPFRGNTVPAAKAAVTKLRTLIDALLCGERTSAAEVLYDHEERLKSLPDFSNLSPAEQRLVLVNSAEARSAIASARFVSTIRDRVNRYRTQDYPAQLAHAAKLAAPAPAPAPSGGGEPKPGPKATVYIPSSSLRAKCGLPFIASDPDLDQWLSSLRKSALEELSKGNRISL